MINQRANEFSVCFRPCGFCFGGEKLGEKGENAQKVISFRLTIP